VKGFFYTFETEKVLKYMKLSTEDKLKWLEEIYELTYRILTEKLKEFRQKIRRGEI
jgi:hypothetical protein